MPLLCTCLGFLLVFSLETGAATAAVPRVLDSDATGLTLELEAPEYRLVADSAGTGLRSGAWPLATASGRPALPFGAAAFAAPPGARVAIEVIEAEYHQLEGVDLAPQATGEPPSAAGSDGFWPAVRASTEPLGSLRGTPTHSLRLYPFSYNIESRTLRVYERLRLRLRFVGGQAPKAAGRADAHGHKLFGGLLNADRAAAWRRPAAAAKALQDGWYDPALPWVKVWVETDGLYRIDAEWLAKRQVATEGIDPRSLRLMHLGREVPLYVTGTADGRLDPEDYLLFYGRFRRDDRDFESLYGRRETYWLTWGGAAGRRFTERSGAPLDDLPLSIAYWDTAHFEEDLAYESLASAPDHERDHWFWNEAVFANDPTVPSGRTYVGALDGLYTGQAYDARIEVALHGLTDLAHHTVLKLNNQTFDDRIWGERGAGQIEQRVTADLPSGQLRDGLNRVVLQVFADQEKWDQVFLNWFRIRYQRRYRARQGFSDFTVPAGPKRIALQGFAHAHVALFDVTHGVRLTAPQINAVGDAFSATFEDAPPGPAQYVAADSLSWQTPGGVLDRPSQWRRPERGADYLILTPTRFARPLERLAEHRRAQGLTVEVVEVEDLYDEFAYGRFTAEALRDFIAYAYRNWSRRPAYVLLAGDTHYDYRNRLGSRRLDFVPSLYYQARDRGHAASDFLYSLVDGDDLLPDIAIGRLPAGTSQEMEATLDKIIAYDQGTEPGPWRGRAILLANPHQSNFIEPSDQLATRFIDPLGFEAVKIYNQSDSSLPNADSKAFIDALNEGALLVNYNGHGSPPFMVNYFILSETWDYMGRVRNGRRLPLIVALSCLNGQFFNPKVDGLGEVFTRRANGGAIAYISAGATSFVRQNNLMGQRLYDQLLQQGNLAFGPALNAAKIQTFAAHPGGTTVLRTMHLLGDPAQRLALPQAADYAPLSLHIGDGPVFGGSTVRIEAQLRNHARLTADSLEVSLIARNAAGSRTDTLLAVVEPGFSGRRDLTFDWPVADRRGPWDFELALDPRDLLAETDKANNRLSLRLDILQPVVPTPVFPAAAAVVLPANLGLEAAVPPAAGTEYQFELAAAPAFGTEQILQTFTVAAVNGVATAAPENLVAGQAYFWRARAAGPDGVGPWSPSRSFRIAAAGQSRPLWSQRGAQLLQSLGQDLALRPDGSLGLDPTPRPPRPDADTREDGFTVRGLRVKGTGVLATDGTYLYVKRWYNDASTIYPGTDFFARVGTGFNGTVRGRDYGDLADSTTAGVAATFHDGYIYSENGRAFELERIDPQTGVLDTIEVPTGLMHWLNGRIEDGHSLITSDGRYMYNVAMGSDGGVRTEWSVRVLDPADSWRVIRQFTSPPTETGFTYQFTDGILADGQRLYFIEFGGQRRIRMVDAQDGALLDEWQSDQELTRIISGQYDPLNDKIWLGDLQGPAVFRYSGGRPVEEGRAVSPPVGPAAAWRSVAVQADGTVTVALETETNDGWQPLAGYTDLPHGTSMDLSGLDAALHRRLRLTADLGTDGALQAWEADFTPLPSLALQRAEARAGPAGLHVEADVRNLSAFAVDGARLRLERDGRSEPLAEVALDRLERGHVQTVFFDSLALPPARARLFVRLVGPADADPTDDRLEVPLILPNRLPLILRLRAADRAFVSGDHLPPGEALQISAPALEGAHFSLDVNGQAVEADSVHVSDGRLQALFRSPFADGNHRLTVRLLRGTETLGTQTLRYVAGQKLAVLQALPYPHPVRDATAFTFVLTRPAHVTVEVYGLNGRRIRVLEAGLLAAGFGQVAWDGSGENGEALANGTYLYRIAAEDDEGGQAVFRGPVVVAR